MAELRLAGLEEYRSYVEAHPEEWAALDGCCHITISRFFRDRPVFEALTSVALPRLVAAARQKGLAAPTLRIWSAGCGAGEEPYSLALIGRQLFPDVRFEIVATDADAQQLERARAAVYRPSSFRELPEGWAQGLDDALKRSVTFLQQDLRREAPDGPFVLVACRNAAFSYFDPAGQRWVAERIAERLEPDGVLMVGLREEPPAAWFEPIGPCLFVKRPAPGAEGLRPGAGVGMVGGARE